MFKVFGILRESLTNSVNLLSRFSLFFFPIAVVLCCNFLKSETRSNYNADKNFSHGRKDAEKSPAPGI